MSNDLEPSKKNEIAKSGDSNELLPWQGMVEQVETVLNDLDLVKKEAIEGFYIFKDLVCNEGEGSSATKEQMSQMLQIYLHTVETRLRTIDTLIKSKKVKEDSGTNINIMGNMDRRQVLQEIEKIMEVDDPEIKVLDEEESDGEAI